MQTDGALERDGYVGPIAILSRDECREVAAYLRRDDHTEPDVWEKARGVHERFLYDLATRPEILGRVTAAIGPDVVLWGVSAVSRVPGQVHPWHSDIESCGVEGGFVSVWIGIENTSRDSTLQLIAGSHRLGRSLQEARSEAALGRDEISAETAFQLARELDEGVALVDPEMGDGDAIFFDGRLWHGTDNRRRKGTRTALLLQYASADRALRIPDWDELDWPFVIHEEPRPPVIAVSGTAQNSANHVVPPPTGWSPGIGSTVHTFELPLDGGEPESWRPFPAFHRSSRVVDEVSCHASVLHGGHSPHTPHAHIEEEILIALRGEVELVIAAGDGDLSPRTEKLLPGSFVYYPSWQRHTIRNPGTSPVAYLMLKWRAPAVTNGRAMETEIVRVDVAAAGGAEGFRTHLLLESPTDCLSTLHSHLTLLQPEAGYEPHDDAHDVALVLLDGEIETLGRTVRAPSVVYCPAGEPHGMRNRGTEPARYLVFELHGAARPRTTGSIRSRVAALRRARARRP